MIFIPEIPNNSLQDRLEEIAYIAKAAASSDYYEDELLTFEFNPPAEESKLLKLEEALNAELEEDYKDFLRFSNGAILCFNSAELYNIETIIELDKQEKEDGFPEDYIIIADVVGDGEVLCYSKNKKKYYSCFEGEEDEYDSFSDFLDEAIENIREKVEEYIDLDDR